MAKCPCLNSPEGNIPTPQSIKEELIPKKQVLRDLADTKVPYKRKKNLLLQSGGSSILGALIPPAISAILGFVNNLKKYWSYLMVLIMSKAYYTYLKYAS